MNRVDGVILGVGVVVLVASIVGVILYDETGGPTFNIAWQESANELPEQSDGGTAGEYTFTVNVIGGYLAATEYDVDVTANGVRVTPDQVDVRVSGPGGLTDSCVASVAAGPSGSGSCTARVDVQDAPEDTTASGETAAEAAMAAEADMDSAMGEGTWTVTVTITAGTGAPGPGAASYSIAVTPRVVEWTANATPLTPDGSAAG